MAVRNNLTPPQVPVVGDGQGPAQAAGQMPPTGDDGALNMGAGPDDDRLRRPSDPGRQDRTVLDRAYEESRVLNDDQRLELFKNSFTQAALPDLPRAPGWHNIWLSTTNPKDPIHFRLRIGYELIRAKDVPGYEIMMVKNPQSEFDGCIMVAEMVAARIPMSLYQKYMKEVHHDAPREEEGRLRSTLDTIRQHAEGKGSQWFEGNGMRDLGNSPTQPSPFGAPMIRTPEDDGQFLP